MLHIVETLVKPSAAMVFTPTDVEDVAPVEISAALGDPGAGAHGTFVRWPAGFSSSAHVHEHDYFAVVVSGVMVNHPPGEEGAPLTPGSYWSQRGGVPHITTCVSETDGLFFIYQPGAWDHLVVTE